MKQYVSLFKALSDPTRLRIMVLLSEKELCVCQIEDALDLSQVKVSRHLNVLRHAGLVRARRDGLWMYYTLVKPKNCLEKCIYDCFEKCLREKTPCSADIKRMSKCCSRGSSKKRSNHV